jgi:adenylate cyclase
MLKITPRDITINLQKMNMNIEKYAKFIKEAFNLMNFKKRKLRVDIVTIFAVLMAVISLTIISYSFYKNSNIILVLGKQLVEQKENIVANKLNEFIRPASLLDTSTTILNDGLLDSDESNGLINYMHVFLITHPHISAAYIADLHSNMFIETRPDSPLLNSTLSPPANLKAETKYISGVIRPANGKTFITAIFKNKNGKVIGKSEIIPLEYNPEIQTWYLGATESKTNRWIGVNKLHHVGELITVSEAIKTADKISGVFGVDINSNIIPHYLSEYKVSKHSQAFIVDNSGDVISPMTEKNPQKNTLSNLRDMHDSPLPTAYQIFRNTGQTHFNFQDDGVTFIATFVPYSLNAGKSWAIVVIVPEDDFIGGSEAASHRVLLFSTIVVLLGLILVYIFAQKVSSPIILLAHDVRGLKRFRFKKSSVITTHVLEVQVLIEAFNAAKNALSSFAKYVPKTLIEKLMETGTVAEVGGERKEITILFSDIRGFTDISENMTPEDLMSHISVYVENMTQVIHQYQGNVDKYIGDAVMTFWGAPIDDAEHATHGCFAALMCRYRINQLNEIWLHENKPVLYTRYGLNTGAAIVGNMGSSDRLNYTAIGDNVNLASRLEGMNKVYGTEILVSESVYLAAKDQFLFRPVDKVRVKGKTALTAIYELVAKKDGPDEINATTEQLNLCVMSFEAYAEYHEGDKTKGIKMYQNILEKSPHDAVALYYLKISLLE